MGLFGLFKKENHSAPEKKRGQGKKKPFVPAAVCRKGLELYRTQQYEEAFLQLDLAIVAADEAPTMNANPAGWEVEDALYIEAALTLGRMKENGEGTFQNVEQAFWYYDRAAKRGSQEGSDAIMRLALDNDQEEEALYLRAAEVAEQRAEETGTKQAKEQAARLRYKHRSFVKHREEEAEAENWEVELQFDRGLNYYKGSYWLPQNYAKALYWFEKAAGQGFASAQFNVALMYSNGEGTKKDINMAIKWYKAAAAQGNINAIHNLGVLFWNRAVHSSGTDKIAATKESFYWYCRLAALGRAKGSDRCRKLLLSLTNWEPPMKELRIRMRKEAEQGGIDEKYYYGYFMRYYSSYAMAMNARQEAFHWMEQAAEQGHAGAKYELSLMYRNGRGVEEDEEKSLHLWEEAAECGWAEAQYSLALSYLYASDPAKKDVDKALDLIQRAADKDYAAAQQHLGIRYYRGEAPFEQDKKKAAHWLREAAENEDLAAMCQYAQMLAEGDGVLTDKEKARELLQEAIDRKYEPAQDMMNRLFNAQ